MLANPNARAQCRYEAGARHVQVNVSGPGSRHHELRSAATTFGFYADDYLEAARA